MYPPPLLLLLLLFHGDRFSVLKNLTVCVVTLVNWCHIRKGMFPYPIVEFMEELGCGQKQSLFLDPTVAVHLPVYAATKFWYGAWS